VALVATCGWDLLACSKLRYNIYMQNTIDISVDVEQSDWLNMHHYDAVPLEKTLRVSVTLKIMERREHIPKFSQL
jgi:hypothetical protein